MAQPDEHPAIRRIDDDEIPISAGDGDPPAVRAEDDDPGLAERQRQRDVLPAGSDVPRDDARKRAWFKSLGARVTLFAVGVGVVPAANAG
jgi:hypothetical protein